MNWKEKVRRGINRVTAPVSAIADALFDVIPSRNDIELDKALAERRISHQLGELINRLADIYATVEKPRMKFLHQGERDDGWKPKEAVRLEKRIYGVMKEARAGGKGQGTAIQLGFLLECAEDRAMQMADKIRKSRSEER